MRKALRFTVAVTRPQGEAGALVRALQARGANVVEVPLIRFAPPASDAPISQALRDFHGWVALTSPQGVRALLAYLQRQGLDAGVLRGLKVAAVGSGTAEGLREHGIRVDFLPSSAGARHLGAELPASRGEVVLHLTSPLAEQALQDALEARGLQYRRVELYRTAPAELTAADLAALRAADVITLASGSAARHLAAVLGTGVRVAVMGAQTAQAALQAGFQQVSVARQPTLEALADAALLALNAGKP